MIHYVMQANDSVTGSLYVWIALGEPAFGGAGYPGPNSAVRIRCVAVHDNVIRNEISPASITTTQNNYNPTGLSTAGVVRLTSTGAQSITGIQGGYKGRVLFLYNIGSADINLLHSNAGSGAANRFSFAAGTYLLSPNACVMLVYDSVSTRWRAVGPTVDANQINDGNSGTAITINFETGPFHKITLTGNATVTFLAPPRHRHVQLDWVQDGTGGRSITFSPQPKWAGGIPPTWATGANQRNAMTMFWNGTDYVASGLVAIDLV